MPLNSILYVLPSKVVDQFETPRWILLTVCVVGVVMAYVTDEGYSLLADDECSSIINSTNSKPLKGVAFDQSAKLPGYSPLSLLGILSFVLSIGEWANSLAVGMIVFLPESLAAVSNNCVEKLRKKLALLDLYREGLQLMRFSKTKRHFSYLLEKKALNIPIRADETEIDSYLECKDLLNSKDIWPFTWEVTNVKDEKIRCCGYECIPMSSYSYLDLMRDNRVQSAAIAAAQEWSSGNHGPRMLGGNTKILRDLEGVIAKFFNREDCLLCATGFLACMSATAAVSTENTVIFADSRLHSSLATGLKIGEGKTVRFRHNNFEDCEEKIKQFRHQYTESWMVVESVYSMDGNICNLPAAWALCQKYNIKLMIDEAHGLGVVGKTGRGVEEHFGLQGCATFLVGTFSKSIASIGGYITGPKRLVSYLDFHVLGNVFSAPLPAYCAGAAIKSFELIDEEPQRVTKTQAMSQLLRESLETGCGFWPADYPDEYKFQVDGNPHSTVIPVVFPDDVDRVVRIATALKIKGYMCSAVAYPACALRRPRFRITGTAAYTPEIITTFVKTLIEVCMEQPPSDFRKLLS